MEGVLKSWAIPKGPSMDSRDKRLAMMVEDHPWDYRNFEGIIPEGYGAGTVIVWDEGVYEPAEKQGAKLLNEKHLLHELHKGSVNFTLKGKKLKGSFILVKTPARGENAWLLIKSKDKYALKTDVTKKERSVQSGKTLQEVSRSVDRVWKSNHAATKTDQSAPSTTTRRRLATIKYTPPLPEKTSAKKAIRSSEGSNWKKIDKIILAEKDEVVFGKCKVTLSDVEREIWNGISKAQLIEYYHKVSRLILTYIKDRPQSLHIKPVNAHSDGFYIKDMEGHEPDCADIFNDIRKHKKAGKRDNIDYLVCNN